MATQLVMTAIGFSCYSLASVQRENQFVASLQLG